MEYIELLNNRNMKGLLKKKCLTEELVREIKTSFFIHPSTEEEDGLYAFNYNNYADRKVIELFTSLEEYNKVYSDNEDYVPLYWYFNQFEHSFDEDTKGMMIDPASDEFFIPDNVCFLIMDDIDDTNRTIKLNEMDVDSEDLKELESKRGYVTEYLANKTKVTYIPKLFNILSRSILYVLYESDEPLNKYFENDRIPIDDVNFHYHKKDNHIIVFTDKNDFKDEMNSNSHYTYGISDLICIIQTIFELDYEGLILKTPENEFILARHRLLKYWDSIVENYDHIGVASEYAFKIVEDEK